MLTIFVNSHHQSYVHAPTVSLPQLKRKGSTQKQPPMPTLFLDNPGFETMKGLIWELFEVHQCWGHSEGVNVKAKKQEVAQGDFCYGILALTSIFLSYP